MKKSKYQVSDVSSVICVTVHYKTKKKNVIIFGKSIGIYKSFIKFMNFTVYFDIPKNITLKIRTYP